MVRPGQRAAAQVGDAFLLPGARTDLGVGVGEFGGAAFDAAFEARVGVLQLAPDLDAVGDVVAQAEQAGAVCRGDSGGVDLDGPHAVLHVEEIDLQVAQGMAFVDAARDLRAEAVAVAGGGPFERMAADDFIER